MKPLVLGETTVTPGRTIAESDLLAFSGLTGDFTPLHIDEEFARATPYGGRIAHGALISAVATGMATHAGLFGERVIGALESTWSYRAPVRIGDTIRSEVTIGEIRPSSKPGRAVATYDFKVLNQHGAEVQTGRLIVVIRAP